MNLYNSGLLLAVFGPLALYGLGKAGVSETCANELVQLAPSVLGVLLAHFDSWRKGRVTLGGVHK